MNKVASISGGRSSMMMAKILADNCKESYIDMPVFIFANTGKEMPETLDFINECDERWGLNVVWVEYCPVEKYRLVTYETASRNGEPFKALIEKRKFLPHVRARFCTTELKIKPIRDCLMEQFQYRHWDVYIGIRYDEKARKARHQAAQKGERWTPIYPLYDMLITAAHVREFWKNQPFNLAIEGWAGNCDFCFLKGKNKKIALAKEFPEKIEWWKDMEHETGHTFRKEYSMYDIEQWARIGGLFRGVEPEISCLCGDDV
jgi:3'-phosphoadenosine 5'-phosphosulfate sulfotransferase (PAPS reductase)/FAD synthetase